MFNFNTINHASQFWSCTIASLRRYKCQNNRFRSHRFLSSTKKTEKPPSEEDKLVTTEIAIVKECKTPPEVSSHKCYSYIKETYTYYQKLSSFPYIL